MRTKKTMLVQISDIHCRPNSDKDLRKIDKAIDAVKGLGKVESAVFIFSGDLTNTAAEDELEAGKIVIERFLTRLQAATGCTDIPVLIVPGNHDIRLDNRTASEINSWNKEEHLPSEIGNMSGIMQYCSELGCFPENSSFDRKIIDLKGLRVQFCLLNSAPFSTRGYEDKELHYIPEEAEEVLKRDESADLKISIMHHSHEWCDWRTKNMVQEMMDTDDVTFFGHEHDAEALRIRSSKGARHNIVRGGEFNLDLGEPSTFNTLVYNKSKMRFETYTFQWNVQKGLFESANRFTLAKKLLKDPIPDNIFVEFAAIMIGACGIVKVLEYYFSIIQKCLGF